MKYHQILEQLISILFLVKPWLSYIAKLSSYVLVIKRKFSYFELPFKRAYLHSTVNYLCSGKGLLQSFRFNYNYLKTHSDCYCLFHPFQVWFLLLSHVWFNFNKYSWKSRLHSSMIAPKFKHWSNKTRELLRYQSNSTSIHNRVTLIYYWQLFGLKRLFSF